MKSNKKSGIRILIIALILVFLGYFIINKFKSNTDTVIENTSPISRYSEKQLEENEILHLESTNNEIIFNINGVITANNTQNISPEISGKIKKIYVEKGQTVEKGDLLVEIGDSISQDNTNLQINSAYESKEILNQSKELTLNQSKSSTDIAYLSYENAKENKKNSLKILQEQIDNLEEQIDDLEDDYDDIRDDLKDIDDKSSESYIALKSSKSELANTIDTLEDNLKQLELSYKSQESQLDFAIDSAYKNYQISKQQYDTTLLSFAEQENQINTQISSLNISKNKEKIFSPIDGEITDIYIDITSPISQGQSILQISSKEKIINSSINEKEKEIIKIGDKVKISINEKEIIAEVSYISNTQNPDTSKYPIEITSYTEENLTENANIDLQIISHSDNKLFIPLDAIFISSNKTQVRQISEGGFLAFKEVKTGTIVNDKIEILEGLEGNENLILASSTFLNEGDRITIKN